ncbi:retrotransposon protein [Hordeum vulgare]|nr:retrotransposon protein [Hordeum vulgare]
MSYVSMEIYECAINFKWEIMVVYGPADHCRSMAFLEELHSKISYATLPVVVGGDFNLIHCVEEKSNCRVNFPRMQLFNDRIVEFGLRELNRVGATLTWTNRHADPTLSVLDQALDLPDDSSGLAPEEWIIRYDLEDQLAVICSNEEDFWRQCGTQCWVLRGGANTAYFKAIVKVTVVATPSPSFGMGRPFSTAPLRFAPT